MSREICARCGMLRFAIIVNTALLSIRDNRQYKIARWTIILGHGLKRVQPASVSRHRTPRDMTPQTCLRRSIYVCDEKVWWTIGARPERISNVDLPLQGPACLST